MSRLGDKILYVTDRPAGFRQIFDFCKAVEDGKNPDSDTLKLISDALWLIVTEPDHDLQFGLSQFADKLNLKSIQGKSRDGITGEAWLHIGSAVVEYQAQVKAGKEKIPASDFVGDKYGKSGKTIRRWARIYKSEVDEYKSVIRTANEFHAKMKARQQKP